MAFFISTIKKKSYTTMQPLVRRSMTDRGDALPFGDETTAACWKWHSQKITLLQFHSEVWCSKRRTNIKRKFLLYFPSVSSQLLEQQPQTGADVLGFQLAFHHFLVQWTALLRIGTQHPWGLTKADPDSSCSHLWMNWRFYFCSVYICSLPRCL